MAARIFRINYKSDFILTMQSDAGWATPFCIKFWTGAPSIAYFAGWDGTTYVHCALDGEDPTKLHVHFDDHHLPIGDLKFQIAYHFTVEDFPNNTEDEVINQAAVIIDQDGTQMQVMLDLNGETAPEIEFNLPAYANEAQRIANENQRIANEAQRIANEEQRIANEEQRISNEEQRIAAESIRIANEESRISEFAQLKHDAEIATADANAAATLANEKAALAAEKAALSQAAAELANAKATLAQQKADYAKAQGDYAKAQGDYAKDQGNIAEADHERAESDHTRAENDHTAVEVYVDSLGAFDISAYHATGGVLAKYVDLSAALDGGDNIPEAIRKGGMSVKFVQSSDNKYVQYRLMHPLDNASTAADDFTNTANWQGVDDEPTAGSDNLVKSGGVSEKLTELAGEVALGAVYDVSVHNNNATFASLSALLSDANLDTLIPTAVRKGGMSIKFVQSSDNKYIQARCLAQNFTTDTTQWAIAEEGVYVENPEYIYVKTDNENKILWAIKTDGSIYYGAGVPPQVIDYIQQKINELSLDEYENIVAFLNGLEEGDKTLQTLLNEKVDKEEGKSLIDTEYASSQSAQDNPEFLDVTLDAEDKVLEGIQQDGTKVIGGDLNVGGSTNINGDAKILGNMELSGVSYKVIESPEYLAAWVDAEDKVTFGLKADGKTYVGDADFLNDIKTNQEAINEIKSILANIPSNIDWDALSSITAVESPEFIEAKTDSEGKLLAGRTPDGAAFENVGFSTPKVSTESVNINGHIVENIEDLEGRSEITTDAEGKIISYRDTNGVKHENIGIESKNIIASEINTEKISGLTDEGLTELEQALKAHGFTGGQGDWSDYVSNDGKNPLHLDIPRCAILNIKSDYNLSLLSKKGYGNNLPYWPAGIEGVTYDIPTIVEFWDMQGNYFKKKVFMSGQGSSTMSSPKKNIAFDFFDSAWDGDVFAIRFGNWVPQDSFHLKAYAYEPYVGAGVWAYKLYNKIVKSRGSEEDYVWKKALLDFSLNTMVRAYGDTIDETAIFNDTGARCFPDGFPVIVYQNGTFWGIYSWQIKKHRDNYHMNKSNPQHIHLDGLIGEFIWEADGNPSSMNWSKYEVRNPKNLVYAVSHGSAGYKYDADIAQAEIAGNSDGSTVYDVWSAGSYNVGKIVEHNGHKYLNTVTNNTAEPIYHAKNNADDTPDFKNKTGCGWLNVTNTIKVKEYIIELTKVMAKIKVKENAYLADLTPENLAALKNEIETYFDVDNLIDYIIVNDVIRNDDAYYNNWQWTTYDGVKWWCNLYDCNISFGYTGGEAGPITFRSPTNHHLYLNDTTYHGYMLKFISDYYAVELNQRYASLRDSKIISADNIYSIVKTWIESIGNDFFEKENTKWSAIKSVDNMYRIKKWIESSISIVDTVYSYNN